MIKFLFYFLLFYFLFKVLSGGFKFKVYHYHQPQAKQPYKDPEHHREGTITIDPKVPKKEKQNSEKLGEYVDYEEVK